MMAWLWLAIGTLTGALLGVAAMILISRRVWRNVKRLSARAKGLEHLVELGQLAGGLAHEIKNPLSTINVNLKLLEEDLQRYDDEVHGRWLRRLQGVKGETDRLREILDDFLRFAGKYEINLAVTDLGNVLSELADFFSPQAESAHVVMRSSLPDFPVCCKIDSNLIKQAVLNLLLNAVQAMTEGGELLLRLTTARDNAVIEVIDTGPGIAPDELPRIFQVYYSTKKRGSGLGLPTTRRIIREHDGTIRAESELGKGTRFIIKLPLAK